MKHAVIKNGIIVNIVLAEPDFATQMGWVVFPDYVDNKAVGIGWGYDGSNWTEPVEINPTEESNTTTQSE